MLHSIQCLADSFSNDLSAMRHGYHMDISSDLVSGSVCILTKFNQIRSECDCGIPAKGENASKSNPPYKLRLKTL